MEKPKFAGCEDEKDLVRGKLEGERGSKRKMQESGVVDVFKRTSQMLLTGWVNSGLRNGYWYWLSHLMLAEVGESPFV